MILKKRIQLEVGKSSFWMDFSEPDERGERLIRLASTAEIGVSPEVSGTDELISEGPLTAVVEFDESIVVAGLVGTYLNQLLRDGRIKEVKIGGISRSSIQEIAEALVTNDD